MDSLLNLAHILEIKGVFNIDPQISDSSWFSSDVIRNYGNNQVVYQANCTDINGRKVNIYEIFTILEDNSVRKNLEH